MQTYVSGLFYLLTLFTISTQLATAIFEEIFQLWRSLQQAKLSHRQEFRALRLLIMAVNLEKFKIATSRLNTVLKPYITLGWPYNYHLRLYP